MRYPEGNHLVNTSALSIWNCFKIFYSAEKLNRFEPLCDVILLPVLAMLENKVWFNVRV